MNTKAETRVVLLGTGNPNPDPDRWGPAVAVISGDKAYIIDAGVGIVRRAAAAARKHSIEALLAPNLDTAFVTHLHSDHTMGLPDLFLTPWTMGREAHLKLYGPNGIDDMAIHVRRAFQEDIKLRVEGLEPANNSGNQFDVVEIQAGRIFEDEALSVEAISVDHGSCTHAFGFKFTAPDRTIMISGDTRPCETLVEAASGVDLLVHEVYSAARLRARAPEWQRYHTASHTSTKELAAIAQRAQPKKLVLYHQLHWGATHEELLAEIREAGYAGDVVSGNDLDIF